MTMTSREKPISPTKSNKTSSKQVVPIVNAPLFQTTEEVASPSSPTSLQEPIQVANAVLPVLPTEIATSPDGQITLIYEQYNEAFPINNGSITSDAIDEVYCLSFVMEGCWIHLSKYSPAEKRTMEIEGNKQQPNEVYLEEIGLQPKVVYHGLVDGETYYVYVDQDDTTLLREQEELKQRQAVEKIDGKPIIAADDGRGMKSCTCIYGTPCIDEFGCQDWKNRFTIATANGWKGFEGTVES